MKTRIFATLIMALMATALMAQAPEAAPAPKAPQTPEQKAEKRVESLKTGLALNPKQEKKMYNVLLTYYQQMQSVQEQRKALEAKMMNIQNDREDGIYQLLSDEQKAKYEELQNKEADRRAKMKQDIRRRGPAPATRPAPAR